MEELPRSPRDPRSSPVRRSHSPVSDRPVLAFHRLVHGRPTTLRPGATLTRVQREKGRSPYPSAPRRQPIGIGIGGQMTMTKKWEFPFSTEHFQDFTPGGAAPPQFGESRNRL